MAPSQPHANTTAPSAHEPERASCPVNAQRDKRVEEPEQMTAGLLVCVAEYLFLQLILCRISAGTGW